MGNAYISPLFLQEVYPFMPSLSRVIRFPNALCLGLSSIVSDYLCDHYGYNGILLLGNIGCLVFGESTPFFLIILFQIIRYLEIGSPIMPLSTWILNDFNKDIINDASTILNTIHQIASAVGTAIISNLLYLDRIYLFKGMRLVFIFSSICCIFAAILLQHLINENKGIYITIL